MFCLRILTAVYVLHCSSIVAIYLTTSYSTDYPALDSDLYWILEGITVNLSCAIELDSGEALQTSTWTVNDIDQYAWDLPDTTNFQASWNSEPSFQDYYYALGDSALSTVNVSGNNIETLDYKCGVEFTPGFSSDEEIMVFYFFNGDIEQYAADLVQLSNGDTVNKCGDYKFKVRAPRVEFNDSTILSPHIDVTADGDDVTCETTSSDTDTTLTRQCTVKWEKYKDKSIEVKAETRIATYTTASSVEFTLESGQPDWAVAVILVVMIALSLAVLAFAIFIFIKVKQGKAKILILIGGIILVLLTIALTVALVVVESEKSSDCFHPVLKGFVIFFAILEAIVIGILIGYYCKVKGTRERLTGSNRSVSPLEGRLKNPGTAPNHGRSRSAALHDPVKFLVTITTGKKRDASTTANVYLTLMRGQERGQVHHLKRQAFRSDKPALFELKDESHLFPPTDIIISHDNSGDSPSWYLKKIKLILSDGGKKGGQTFVVSNWLKGDRNEKIIPVQIYEDQRNDDERV